MIDIPKPSHVPDTPPRKERRMRLIDADALIEQINKRMDMHREIVEKSSDEIYVLERIHMILEDNNIIETIKRMSE